MEWIKGSHCVSDYMAKTVWTPKYYTSQDDMQTPRNTPLKNI